MCAVKKFIMDQTRSFVRARLPKDAIKGKGLLMVQYRRRRVTLTESSLFFVSVINLTDNE